MQHVHAFRDDALGDLDAVALVDALRTGRVSRPGVVEAVTAQADSLGALQTEARKVELRALVQVRNLLSAEQWQELEAKKRGHRFHDGPKPEAAL